MRKITTYILMLTFILVTQPLWADVTFKFKAPSGWGDNCYLWAWDDNNNQIDGNTSWPGKVQMTLGSDGYYTYTLKTSVTKVNFLFNNGASSGTKQTVDASTTKTKFMGRYGSTNTQGHYNIIEETFVDTDDSGDDDVVTPDNPQPTGEVTIAAIRSRLSINTNDFTDFAGLYVSALPKAGDATVSYEWQYSSNGSSWAKYSGGDGATWDNIRPNKAGYYRCVISYDLAGVITTITSNTLQITNKGGNSVSFSSNLPVILVRTAKDFPTAGLLDNDGVAALKAKRSVDVKILWNEEGGSVKNTDINNADMLHYDRKARMNYRGSSSLRNPKKSYAFVTGDKNCDSKKLGEVKTKKFGMFGAEAQKDWVLYASYPDATYMRNILTFHQYAKMTGLWGVKCRYVELYIDGSYEGIYVFMDKITQDENRVNVNEDTGFIVKFDKTDEVDSYDGTIGYNEDYKRNTFTTTNTGKRHIRTYEQYVDQAFEIEYPEREDLAEFDDDGNLVDDSAWDAKVAEIKGLFTRMESAILANDYATLATIIDYDSWADYFIMNEFSRNADAYRISCVFTINSASDKIVANPMWDYELGWGNQDTKTSGLMVEDDQYYEDDFPTPFWWTGKGKSGCNGILGDCKFRAKVLERWEKHIGTNGALNSTVLNAKIDSLQAALSGSSTKTSVSTNSLKSWVTSRTSGLKSEFNTWDACADLKFALVGTINGSRITSYANGIQFTKQADGSYTASFTATGTSHSLQIITNTGDIWARGDSKSIVSTDQTSTSYASMTKGETTGYANITTTNNTQYTFTFKLNADGASGKLTYTKNATETPDDPDKPITYTELYLKGAITSWGDDENFRLNTTDGDYYVVSYPAGEEVEISGEFKLASTDWSTYNFGAAANTPAIEVGKEYVLTVSDINLQASGVIKASKIEFRVSTKTLKITGVEKVYDVEISAIRDRYSINPRDFKDFAGLYVSKLPKAGDATVSYEWQFASSGSNWVTYSAGDGATWDNIRPNKIGYYRCVLTYDLAGEVTTYTSNSISITDNGGAAVTFSSKLPVILVRTAKDFPVYPGNYPNIEEVEAFKAKRSVDVKILWNEEGGSVTNADINNADMLHYDRKARMNYRGSSSLYNPKRSYAFVSGDKNCDAKKLGEVKTKKFGMFGAAANKDWVLYASYPDATYMRNVLTYHQYAKMTGLWGAKCRYVELYIDGSYQGIYVFMDKITQDENRINVNEDTGYIVKFDKTDIADRYSGKEGANEDYKRNTFTTSNTGRTGISTYNITVDQAFEIEYPEREDLAEFDDDGNLVDDSAWDAKVAGVKNRFEEMERAILANDYAKLATIIDYESWADYFIMNEFTKNADAYRISCVFTLNSLEDKIVANPMWDYELGWGNENKNTSGLLVEEDRYYLDSFPTPFWWIGKNKSGCNGILGDCKFRAIVKERWAKHIGTNGALNSTVLNAKIDSLQTALRGGSAGTSVNTTPLKNWISDRTPALNSVISAWEKCPIPPFVVTPYITNLKCNGGNEGSISLEVSGSVAPYTYTWTYPDGTTANTKDISGLTAGVYTLKIEDSIGEIYEQVYEVTEPEALDVNISVYNVTCGGYPNGMIGLEMSGGTSPIDFSCYDDQKVLSDIVNLKGGNYSVVLTDANGCTFEKEFYIYEPEKLELVVNSVVEPSEFGASDGFIDITVTGGTGSYKYQWSGHNFEADTEDINNLVSNIYELTVKDENNCAVYERIELSEPAPKPFEVNSYVTNLKCNGGNVGSISLEVSGSVAPYTYTWTYPDGTTANTKDISGLTAGIYTLRIEDSIGEIYEETYEVTEPEALNLSANVKDVTCYGFADGAIDIEVTGGTAPYNYSWDVSNVEDLTSLKGGYYRVTVTDAHGCALEGEYIVTEPTILEATILGETIIPYCQENGTLTAEVRGGVAPYTYKWIEGFDNVISTEKTISVVNDDAYYLWAYDANGCEASSKTLVRFTKPIEIEVTSLIHVGVYGESTGIIEIDAAGGTQPYNYQWSGPGIVNPMNQNQYQLPAGIYSVVVTDDFGCEESKGFEIKQPEITTDAQEFDANVIINVGNGLISVSEGDFAIYNVIGQDVTIYNGGLLPGVYMVQVGDNSTKVIMK